MLKTDMNERERARFAKMFREIVESASKCVDALETENDFAFVKHMMMYGIESATMMAELKPVLMRAAEMAGMKLPEE